MTITQPPKDLDPRTNKEKSKKDWNWKGAIDYDPRPTINDPVVYRIGIQMDHLIILNHHALDRLNNPDYVIVSFDPESGLLSIRATDDENDYRVKIIPRKRTKKKQATIYTNRFLHNINYPHEYLTFYEAEYWDGLLVIDIGPTIRSNASKNVPEETVSFKILELVPEENTEDSTQRP